MRTSILTRSAVAVASLAIGSVALTATPATAATPTGITRQSVLAAADNTEGAEAQALVTSVCKTDSDNFRAEDFYRSDDVEGLLFKVYIPSATEDEAPRFCTFTAFATSDPLATLSGSTTVTPYTITLSDKSAQAVDDSRTFPLSGDVTVTEPLDGESYYDSYGTASGDVVKVEQATTSNTRVSTPKSTKYKAKALKAYQRSVAKAESKLSKALEKAGDSTSKKAAARKAFKASKKAARATLHIRWSSDKKTVVTTTVGATTKTPFSVTTDGCRFKLSNTEATAARC